MCVDEDIKIGSAIEEGLGIYGDDAVDFLELYAVTFNLDISKFKASEYFEPEGDTILPSIIRFFTNRKKQVRKILNVKHLERAIVAGNLDEEVINFESI